MIAADYFEGLHAHEDPFGYRHRWYEARKRALLLASLTREHYGSGWELGCSNGVLTHDLAARCGQLLATDLSARAVMQARRQVAGMQHVRVEQAWHPQQRPLGRFDLIVCSEMGYYLEPRDLCPLRDCLHEALEEDGLLVGCHWQVPFAEASSTADQVHAALGHGLQEVFRYEDADVLLQGWARQQVSVAALEGLR